jgi:hypothetical protein
VDGPLDRCLGRVSRGRPGGASLSDARGALTRQLFRFLPVPVPDSEAANGRVAVLPVGVSTEHEIGQGM